MSDNLPVPQYNPSQAVAERGYAGSNSPELDSDDILIPRLKVGQKMSKAVDEHGELYGATYVLRSRDDVDPTVVAQAPAKGELGEPVVFYVHGMPRKQWSWTRPDKSLGRGVDYPLLSDVEGGDPRKVRRTYDYLVTLPDFPLLPVRFLMHGAWAGQAAKQINTDLVLANQMGQDTSEIAFQLRVKKTSSSRSGQEQPFAQIVVAAANVTKAQKAKDQELVQRHAALVGSSNVQELDDSDTSQTAASDNAPSID